MSVSRNQQLFRILGMIRDLSAAGSGLSIQDLLDLYGVTRRTLERDLAAIEAAGYVVETLSPSASGRVRKRIPSMASRLHLTVTAEELASARAGVTALQRETVPAVAARLRALVDRLEDGQSRAVNVDAEALVEAQDFVGRPGLVGKADPAMLDEIRTAILQCRRLRITYRKGGTEVARDYLAEPYGLLYGARNYLVWRGVEDRKWRKFALPHIDRLESCQDSFVHDPSFSLKDFTSDAFGVYRQKPFDVVLRIMPSGRSRLDHYRFHSTQVVEPQPDGGAILRFNASGVTEICWSLFSWGEHLEILEPGHLVDAYRSMLITALSSVPASSSVHESRQFTP